MELAGLEPGTSWVRQRTRLLHPSSPSYLPVIAPEPVTLFVTS